MLLVQAELGKFKNFNYLIGAEETPETAVIDPAWEEEKLFARLKEEGRRLTAILLTHTHHDHMEAVDRVLARCPKARLYVHKKEAPRLIDVKGILPYAYLEGGEVINEAGLDIRVIHTPGHQPGGVCFFLEGEREKGGENDASPSSRRLFTGDTLFIGRCGRVDFPGGNVEAMYESLQRIKALPDDTVLYPGHNYGKVPCQNLSEEKRTNPFLQADDFETFRKACEEHLPRS